MFRLSRLLSGGYLLIALLVTALTLIGFPLGPAPFQLAPLGPAGTPIVVEIAYGTEKRAWLEDAAARFATTNPRVRGRPIQIKLTGVGSREIVTRIVQDEYQPTVVSPASMIQIELLRDEWAKRKGGEIFLSGADAPQPLVITPLVIVMWEERGKALWPNSTGDFWKQIHAALAAPGGWPEVGGKAEWGLVKFGHTSPETSNSGIQSLVLLAYGYHEKATDLVVGDVLDTGFQTWLDEIENSVQEFGDSTGTFMDSVVNFGPGKYDMVAVYESLAIGQVEANQTAGKIEQAEGRWGQPLRIYYPPANIMSEHPYATLSAPWVTPEQREVAALFRTYLLSQPVQELALQYGFRPANSNVTLVNSDPNNPFNRYKDNGVQIDIQQVVSTPPAEVLNELLTIWRRKNYDR